jgi:hypothetical protein
MIYCDIRMRNYRLRSTMLQKHCANTATSRLRLIIHGPRTAKPETRNQQPDNLMDVRQSTLRH